MRFLIAVHNCYTDNTSGAARSLRTMMQWLAEAGHECEVPATARFGAGEPEEGAAEHLARLDVPLTRLPPSRAFTRSVQKPPQCRGRPPERGRPPSASTPSASSSSATWTTSRR